MPTTTLILIEKYIVKPILLFVNILVRITGKITRINHDLSRDFDVIAVCKFKGMGSIIQATPLLQTLRNKYPNAEIIFVSTKVNYDFLSKIDLINTIICLNDKNIFSILKNIVPFLLRLIRKNIKVYIDLEVYSHFSSFVTTASLARNRIGFYLKSEDYRLGIYTHMMYFNINASILQVYLQIARLLHIQDIVPQLYKFENITQTAAKYLNYDYLVININASDLRIERRWDINNFERLIKILLSSLKMKIVLIGSPAERKYVESLCEKINNENLINLSGKTNIEELILTLKYAKLVITNDTGPMHLSFSLRTKTIALFGPCSPTQYGFSQNSVIIYNRIYCSPCVHEFLKPPCNGDNQCMKQISVEEVAKAVNSLINNEDATIENNTNIIYCKLDNKTPLGIVTRKKNN